MNYLFSVAVAAIRALSTFFAGKIVLVSFGTGAFAAHAQLAQVISVMLPVSNGLTSLAVVNAWANSDRKRALRILKISACITLVMMGGCVALTMNTNTSVVSQRIFGTSQWRDAVLIGPLALALASLTSLATASLVGVGKGGWAGGVDAGMATCTIAVAAIAATMANVKWLIFSMIPIFGIGMAVAALGLWKARASFSTPIKPISPTLHATRRGLGSYMLMSLFTSTVAPVVFMMARSTLLSKAGADEAASFIAAQRLAALAVAPVPLYVYTFLSPFFASTAHEQAVRRIRKLQVKLLAALCVIYATLAGALPLVTPLAFSNKVHIPVGLFALVALGETSRVVAALQAQYLATQGQWQKFIPGDFVFLSLFFGIFQTGDQSGTWIAGAYGLAGVGYLVYMTTWGASAPGRITYGT